MSDPILPPDLGAFCVQVHRIYHRLALASSLDPCAEVDALFSQLVLAVREAPPELATTILADPVMAAVRERLQELCAEGEYRLEVSWAGRILNRPAEASWPALRSFPYYRNYERLAWLELQGLAASSEWYVEPGPGAAGPDHERRGPARRALFVGSGPLPLTSIVLAQAHGFHMTNVDLDGPACALGARLAERLGLASNMAFVQRDIRDLADLEGFDVVFVAALVGQRRAEKRAVLSHIARRLSREALVVVRTAQKVRTLLYPGVELGDLGGLVPLLELHPHDEVINSVIIARPAPVLPAPAHDSAAR